MKWTNLRQLTIADQRAIYRFVHKPRRRIRTEPRGQPISTFGCGIAAVVMTAG